MSKKILMVEGNPSVRETMRLQLASGQHEITMCDNFAQAEQFCSTAKADIIILGSNLPEGSACDQLPRLKPLQPAAAIVLLPEEHPEKAIDVLGMSGRNSGIKTLHEIERGYIEEVLSLQGWRVQSAARELGIPRSSLYHKIKQYGLARAVPRSQ